MKVAIIGGGMAGLGSAYELCQEKHVSITVYEKSQNLGGLASCSLMSGAALENFYHHMFPTYYDFLEIAEEIGIKDKIFFRSAKTGVFYGGKIYPFSGPLDLMRFSPLTFWERIKTGFLIAFLKINRSWRRYENILAAEWLERCFGEKIYAILWQPLLESKFGKFAEKVGMVWFWGRIYERPRVFGYFYGGFKTIIDALEKYLCGKSVRIVAGIEVVDLRKENNSFAVYTKQGKDLFDRVIVAAPPVPFLRLASGLLPADFVEKTKKLKYLGSICAIVVLKRHLTPYYWLNINDNSFPFVPLIEQTNFVDPENYGGYHPVYLSKYLDAEDSFYRLSEEEIWFHFLPHLKKINKDFSTDWIVEKHLFRAPFTQPIVGISYQNVRPPYKVPAEGLWWISMSHIYPWDRGTDHSFHSGRELARQLLSEIDA